MNTAAQKLALVLSLLAGIGVSAQSYINGYLGTTLGSPVSAALVNTVSSLALVLVLALGFRRLRGGLRNLRLYRPYRSWWFGAGLLGAAAVSINGFAAPVIGVSLLTVFMVSGQLLGSTVADAYGLGPGGRHRVTAARAFALLFAGLGIVVGTGGHGGEVNLGLFVLVVVAGIGAALQQAGNGQLVRASKEPLVVAVINFTVGALSLTAVFAFVSLSTAAPRWELAPSAPWWAWGGGLLGAGIAVVGSITVKALGVLRLMLGMVAGQSIGALTLDLLTAPALVTVATVSGVLLACLAVVASALGRGSSDPRPGKG